MPSMDLVKLKKPATRRNFIQITNSSKGKMKKEDLIFLNDSFT